MLRSLRATGERGFTLIELLVVVLIVGVLAAVGVPLYLGYVRDARLAEGKSIAGSAMTAAQACAQINPTVPCSTADVAGRLSLKAGDLTPDTRWKVTVNAIVLNSAGQYSAGNPAVLVEGQAGNVENLATQIILNSAGNEVQCKYEAAGGFSPC